METLVCEEDIESEIILEPIEKYKWFVIRKSVEPTVITIDSYNNMIHYYNQLHLTHIEEKDKTIKFRLNQQIDSISAWIRMFKKQLK